MSALDQAAATPYPTKAYRVVAVGVSYNVLNIATDDDGVPVIADRPATAQRGQEIMLHTEEATRLLALDAVALVGSPLTPAEQVLEELKKVPVDERL